MKQEEETQTDLSLDPEPYTAEWYLMMRDVPRRAFFQPLPDTTESSPHHEHVDEVCDRVPKCATEILRIQHGLHLRDQAPMSKKQKKAIQDAIKQTVRELDDLVINMIMVFIDNHCEICRLHLAVGTLGDCEPARTCHACSAKHNLV